jgi:hypothetical protein
VATVVDICNLALARLGDEATVASIDPPEGSAQASHCARFYPMALDTMLDSHYWAFSTQRAALVQLSAAPAFGWTYAYAEPNNSVNIISIHKAGASDDKDPQAFEMESLPDGSTIIYSNVQGAVARYTIRANDPAKYQPLFVESLAWLLASNLAGPVLKGDEGIKMTLQCYKMHKATLGDAKTSDAAQRKVSARHNPEFLAARGSYPPGATADDNPGAWAR